MPEIMRKPGVVEKGQLPERAGEVQRAPEKQIESILTPQERKAIEEIGTAIGAQLKAELGHSEDVKQTIRKETEKIRKETRQIVQEELISMVHLPINMLRSATANAIATEVALMGIISLDSIAGILYAGGDVLTQVIAQAQLAVIVAIYPILPLSIIVFFSTLLYNFLTLDGKLEESMQERNQKNSV